MPSRCSLATAARSLTRTGCWAKRVPALTLALVVLLVVLLLALLVLAALAALAW